jgi:hypothetical protein
MSGVFRNLQAFGSAFAHGTGAGRCIRQYSDEMNTERWRSADQVI